MVKKNNIEISDEAIADLGYVKVYLENLEKLMINYPHSITGDQQRFYIKESNNLIKKVSAHIDFKIKKSIT